MYYCCSQTGVQYIDHDIDCPSERYSEIKPFVQEHNISESAENSEELGSQGESSQTFTAEELLMLESDDEDQEEKHTGVGSSRKSKRKVVKSINKVNRVGETPLQEAAIAGDADKVAELLQQGKPYFPWLYALFF